MSSAPRPIPSKSSDVRKRDVYARGEGRAMPAQLRGGWLKAYIAAVLE
ncbi:MAG: hypothetical protein QXG48_04535 [Thermofilaceae archaeon]